MGQYDEGCWRNWNGRFAEKREELARNRGRGWGVNFGYGVRLVCLSLASFFLVLAVLGLAVSARLRCGWGWRADAGGGGRAVAAERPVVTAAGAWLFVASLCVPSYLWLEPEQGRNAPG